MLTADPEGSLSAVVSVESPSGGERIQRETTIHMEAKHRLILECRASDPRLFGPSTTNLFEVVGNG
jgi:hypothetical protein